MKNVLYALLVISPLAACMAPQPAPAPVVDPVPVIAPVAGISGLQSREPDACHAGDYRQYLGQPGAVLQTANVTRSYRVVEYRGIEPQEYDPMRIVFRLDQAGNIYNVDCG